MRVAAYIRVSTERDEQADSLKNQRDGIIQFIKANDYILVEEYTDIESGTTDERASFKRLMNNIKSRKFDIIVCKELSRLARNGELAYKLKGFAESYDVQLVTLDGTVDTTDQDKQDMFRLYGWIYEQESRRISRRIKTVFKTKAQNGEYLGSIPPYGYRIDDKKLIPRGDYTADVLVNIFDKYLDGWGVDRIATYLTKSGIETPAQVSGKKDAGWIWHGSSVKKILENQAYVGDLVAHRETTVSAINKKRKKVPKSEQIIIPNTHIPLIAREVWERVQVIMENRKTNRSKAKGNKNLFVGFLVCPDCGRGFHFRQDRKGYICGGYGKYGKHVCTSHIIKEQKLINLILADIKTFCLNIDKVNIIEKVKKKNKKSDKTIKTKISKISRQLEKLKKRRINYIDLLADGDITKEDYNERIAENKAEVDSLEKEKASLEDSLNNSNDIDKLTFLKTELDKFLKFDTLTKEMLNLLVEKIEVHESGEPVIYYRFAPVFEAVI